MPLFDYRCQECGHLTEFLESPDSDARHQCEHCGSERVAKVISAFAIRRKGSTSSEGSRCPTGTCPLS